jgi:alpha-L-fucosidase
MGMLHSVYWQCPCFLLKGRPAVRRLLYIPLLFLAALVAVAEEAPYHRSPENLEARAWFRDAKFGLFIHWGVYSVLGDGEWVMNNRKMTVQEYEKLPARFNPTRFDPAAWVSLAKAAGMRYITITSKHHDGFAMWDSKVSDWTVPKRTPYHKDILKMLADECHKQGIKLFFYYSHLDWHHPDYYPRGQTGHNAGRPDHGDFNRYLDYMDAQLTELCSDYGPIAGIWFDGWWDQQVPKEQRQGDPKKTLVDWRLRRTYDLIHRLQPQALIGNNHHVAPFPGEDFQMFEKDLPGGNTAGFNADSKPAELPLETCETINNAWGYNRNDKNCKSTKTLIHYLVRAAGQDANFLLNVGPRPDGTIQPEFVERLHEMGRWLRRNGFSIYATRGGPVAPQSWGVTTRSKTEDKVFVHVLDPKAREVKLPGAGEFARGSATRLHGGKVPMRLGQDNALYLELPEEGRDPVDTIVVLKAKS